MRRYRRRPCSTYPTGTTSRRSAATSGTSPAPGATSAAPPAPRASASARIDVDAGSWSTPAHVEGAAEEIFYVLDGSGLSWQDGAVYEVGAGRLPRPPARRPRRTRSAPGRTGSSVLAYGHRIRHGNTVLPRAGVAWMYPGYVDVTTIGERRHPFNREAEAGEPEVGEPAERPASIVNVDDVEPERHEHSESLFFERDLGRAAGSVRTGISHVTIPAGPRGLAAALPLGRGGDLRRPRRRGDRSSWTTRSTRSGKATSSHGRPEPASRTRSAPGPPTSSTSPTERASPTTSPTTRARSKVSLRGVGVMGRIEPLGYWDGEP